MTIATTRPLRIFLSYGRDEHAEFAVRLKQDLEELGYEVWFDRERLRAGGDWEIYIEKGLEWVADDPQRGRIVLLMTPHSVRRPDGYCLNEIARALSLRLPVVPVMVVWCEPPLSICRIQWLDMRDCVPVPERRKRYEAKLSVLAEALESGELDMEGGQSRLLRLLEPLPFDADIEQHLSRFAGREWLLEEIDAWLADEAAEKILWIKGAPGSGKSAISAWLCRHRPEIAALHMCQFNHRHKADPRRCVLSLAYQLSTQLADYAQRLHSLGLERSILESDARTLFDDLIVQPLSGNFPDPGRLLLMVIDGLDEASSGGRNELASFLAAEFPKTPDWLRLIVTSRPDPEVEYPLQGLTPLDLDSQTVANEHDIRAFLERELEPLVDSRRLTDSVETIVRRSEGVFLYAEWTRRELARGRLSLENPDALPRGLGGVYAQWFEREFPSLDEYEGKVRPLLELLAASLEPLPVELALDILGWDEVEGHHALRALGSLFELSDGRVKAFHSTLLEWLSEASKAGPYLVAAGAGQRRIAEHGWARYEDAEDLGPYLLNHLPRHLAAVGRWSELVALLTEARYLEQRLAGTGGGFALLEELATARAALPRSRAADAGLLEAWARALESVSHVLDASPELTRSQLYSALAEAHGPGPIRAHAAKALAEGAELAWLKQETWRPNDWTPAHQRTLTYHRAPVLCLAFSPSGRLLASADSRGAIRIGELASGSVVEALSVPGPVNGLTFLDEHTLVSGYAEAVTVWDLKAQKALHRAEPGASALALLPVSGEIVTATAEGELMWRKIPFLEPSNRIPGAHVGRVSALLALNDGRRFASAGEDRQVRLWDSASRTLLHTWSGHADRVECLAVSSDDAVLASGSRDHRISLWDVTRSAKLGTLAGHSSIVAGLAFLRNGQRLLSGSYDTTIRLWDVGARRSLGVVASHDSWVCALATEPASSTVVSGDKYGRIRLWSSGLVEDRRGREGHGHWILAATLLGDELYASASRDRTVRVWAAGEDGGPVQSLIGHAGWVRAVALGPEEGTLCSGSDDRTVRVWRMDSPKEVRRLEHGSRVRALASGKGWIAAAGEGSRISLWSDGSHEILELDPPVPWITNLAPVPGSPRLLVRGSDRTVRLIDLEQRRQVAQLVDRGGLGAEPIHRRSRSFVSCSPSGRYVCSGDEDRGLRVWRLAGGEPVLHLSDAHRKGVNAGCILAGDQHLVSGEATGEIRVWRIDSGTLLARFLCRAPVVSLCEAGTGRIIVIEGSLPRPRLRVFRLVLPGAD